MMLSACKSLHSTSTRYGFAVDKQINTADYIDYIKEFDGADKEEARSLLLSLLQNMAKQNGGVLSEVALQEVLEAIELNGIGDISPLQNEPTAETTAMIFANKSISSMLARNSQLLNQFVSSEVFDDGYDGPLKEEAMANIAMALADGVQAAAEASGYHALTTLESEYSFKAGEKPTWSFLAVQPLYESEDLKHNVFAQLSHERQADRKTYNAGASYRYMPESEMWLAGVNAFYDYQRPYGHKRYSVGADFQTSLYGAYTNFYKGMNGWTDSRFGYEERPLDGYDFSLSGRLEQLPNLQAFAKLYKWNRIDDEKDILGREVKVEYTPFPILTLESSYSHENEEKPGWRGALRLNYKIGQGWDELWDRKAAARLTSMEERRFEKVRRENRIRTQERLKPSFEATISLSLGAGNLIGGAPAVVGATAPLNTNIVVPVGNFLRLEFGDGAILNISAAGAQLMIVKYDLGSVTLVSGDGFIQYISNDSVDRTVNVPGGTITLDGTDIDVRMLGGKTTVRVRDGGIELRSNTGTSQRAVSREILSLMAGTVTQLASTNADYIAHEQDAYTGLDTVPGVPVTTNNAAPYIIEAPSIVNVPMNIGENLDIKIVFSKAVTVTGAPHLDLDIKGDDTITAGLFSGNGTNELVFRHTIRNQDGGSTEVIVNALDLNGGTISAGGLEAIEIIAPATLEYAELPGGTPIVTAVTAPADGNYIQGQSLDWLVEFDQDVTVAGAGTPRISLTLNSGSVFATYESNTAADTLRFRYIVADADSDNNGVALSNTIDLNGGTIRNASNDDINLDLSAFNPATPNVQIVAPVALNSSTPADNDTDTSIGTNIVLNFDQNIVAGSGSFTITDSTDGSDTFTVPIGDGRIDISGAVLTIDLSATLLDYNTDYEITAPGGIVENAAGRSFPALTSGDLNFTTAADPTAGFGAPDDTITVAAGTGSNFEPATSLATWSTTLNITGNSPNGVIFESGGTGRGIAAWFHNADILFAGGAGSTTATNAGSIFISHPIASVPQGLHHFVFVALPQPTSKMAIYIDGIKVSEFAQASAMTGNEWAGTNGAGYGRINSSIRTGGNSNALNGDVTLLSDLNFYSNKAPADF